MPLHLFCSPESLHVFHSFFFFITSCHGILFFLFNILFCSFCGPFCPDAKTTTTITTKTFRSILESEGLFCGLLWENSSYLNHSQAGWRRRMWFWPVALCDVLNTPSPLRRLTWGEGGRGDWSVPCQESSPGELLQSPGWNWRFNETLHFSLALFIWKPQGVQETLIN